MVSVPNKPRPENRHRMVRVEDELWEAAGRAAAEAGTTRSEVMRAALRALVTPGPRWCEVCQRHGDHKTTRHPDNEPSATE